jgi:hypothetical protein
MSEDQHTSNTPKDGSSTEGGMSTTSGASAPGNSGPVASEGPPSEGGGMSSSSGASAAGDPGPIASHGPDAYQQGYEKGQHDQSVKDREQLVHENPIGDLARGIASGGKDFVEKGIDAVIDKANEVLDHSTRPESVQHAENPPNGPDAGVPDEVDATVPDATVNPHLSSDGIQQNSGETNPANSNYPNQSFDPSQPHDPGQSHDSSQSFDPPPEQAQSSMSQVVDLQPPSPSPPPATGIEGSEAGSSEGLADSPRTGSAVSDTEELNTGDRSSQTSDDVISRPGSEEDGAASSESAFADDGALTDPPPPSAGAEVSAAQDDGTMGSATADEPGVASDTTGDDEQDVVSDEGTDNDGHDDVSDDMASDYDQDGMADETASQDGTMGSGTADEPVVTSDAAGDDEQDVVSSEDYDYGGMADETASQDDVFDDMVDDQ